MKRSVENAEHAGLFTRTAGQHVREAQRHRHSQDLHPNCAEARKLKQNRRYQKDSQGTGCYSEAKLSIITNMEDE
ncbi:unnamed protein product [Fusarium equiseti]|uniref:Uncharacterized protein n=1 Tax=Fusarium equiseti TaxID=61235 RepID=A0A8J2IFK5_FUSEQ|nr:unnamed protein product [Fusarium equiseti]